MLENYFFHIILAKGCNAKSDLHDAVYVKDVNAVLRKLIRFC